MKHKSGSRNITRRKAVLHAAIYILFLLLLYVSPSMATHKVDHRFTVFGKVREGTSFPGKPLPGKMVTVTSAKTGEILATVLTDRKGRYSALLHVHNQNRGMRIVISSGGAREELKISFDPSNRVKERKERVDLIVFPKNGK